ncbi:MAG: hypothetical protein GWN76_06810 [candidate division Zixibacteria bacterium]|nr:hypothetical protein [candidate division Zixibacteria bacterium]NIU13723.1 hypothetical protein [candidate division Zixibacteria bacterium]
MAQKQLKQNNEDKSPKVFHFSPFQKWLIFIDVLLLILEKSSLLPYSIGAASIYMPFITWKMLIIFLKKISFSTQAETTVFVNCAKYLISDIFLQELRF